MAFVPSPRLFGIVLGVIAADAAAVELRPFNPPSVVAPRMQIAVPIAPPVGQTASNAYYENFAREVKQMNPQRVAALRIDFQARLTQAKGSGRNDERAHYERMLGILDAYGKSGK